MRILCLESVGNEAASSAHCRWPTDCGGELRTSATLPLHLTISDRLIAGVPFDPDRPREGAVVVRSPGLVAALCALFEQCWHAATPWGAPQQRDETGLSDQERELLRLLNSGLTDQSASTKLGVSLRTVRRIMSDLMTRTQVKSRFQMGLMAGKRGWFSPTADRKFTER
ncbi:helix-turn-helix transcriptional regulator [Streptacidiphilus sp. BW17]|uniref:helix-turn-helix transcriptional regulator n=1 Tax=Streptacidiphilus sp. BW17 TaxID=3156274 RepID=UPI0035135C5E